MTHPPKFKILCLGDTCIDEYYYGTCDRLSPEAPVPVLKITKLIAKGGMVANVVDNLTAFDCEVTCIAGNNTSVKKRYIDDRSKQHIVRVDDDILSDCISIDHLILYSYDAIVISDYNKGAIEYDTIQLLRKMYNGPIFVDTKKPDLAKFEGCYVKINESEFNASISSCSTTIVTLGDKGARYKSILYSCSTTEVIDVCGAGDTFLAALTVKFLQTLSMPTAIAFANKCSAITVEHQGVYALTTTDIASIENE